MKEGSKNPAYANVKEEIINQQHFETLQEVARQERLVAESVQNDNVKLKEQLAKVMENKNRLEQTIADQNYTTAENKALYAEKAQLQIELQQAATYISNLGDKCLDSNT